jgi:hypothetical protein
MAEPAARDSSHWIIAWMQQACLYFTEHEFNHVLQYSTDFNEGAAESFTNTAAVPAVRLHLVLHPVEQVDTCF